jgi:hypothetical protein
MRLNRFLQLGVLFTKKNSKEDWQFDGFVVSDWGSINEMIAHGFAKTVNRRQKLLLMRVLIWIWNLVLM